MSSVPTKPHASELPFEHQAERDRLHKEALEWLRTNRHRYAGQWVALHGSRLLAVGATARDMYSQIGEEVISPFVARIEGDTLPFAGW